MEIYHRSSKVAKVKDDKRNKIPTTTLHQSDQSSLRSAVRVQVIPRWHSSLVIGKSSSLKWYSLEGLGRQLSLEGYQGGSLSSAGW
ncbi:hypothetical protein DPMN_026048 [Dreissena polymorpha]|uniref:Uncharacterized protein n=1 Tax=Dreissena polymorpha TaxID=45954 RepID=A0A9D4RE71_DREPO|nr:hypothetical protein DPMN_026022 [Dreissena polymorpha]KAH3863070.1 hypothetical protein DPMN_026048 [Dreissena polymorpha]